MQSYLKMRMFTSLCHEVSAAQQRETEQQQQQLDPSPAGRDPQKSFPVSSGEEHSVVCVTPLK